MILPKNIIYYPVLNLGGINFNTGRGTVNVVSKYDYSGIVRVGCEGRIVFNSNKDGETTNTIQCVRIDTTDCVFFQNNQYLVPIDGYVYLNLSQNFTIDVNLSFQSVQTGTEQTILTITQFFSCAVALFE